MKNLLLIAMFAATPAAAQEFAADMPALGDILARARIYKVKHAGRPPAPYIGRYEPRHMRFELRRDVTVGSDESVYLNKSILILYQDSPIATLKIYDMERGMSAAVRLAKALEDLRLRAVTQGQLIAVDYAEIARHNETGAWRRRDYKECELLNEIIRAEHPAASRACRKCS